LPDDWTVPCVNNCLEPATRTPLADVDPEELAKTSEKSDPLKPVTPELEILLPITASRNDAEFNTDGSILKAM
jgi:hypothetical protein